jgi:hypothetical protein
VGGIMKKKYYIKFDTQEYPGKIKAWSVVLDTEIISDLNKKLPINLREHPLYPALYAYVAANPPIVK